VAVAYCSAIFIVGDCCYSQNAAYKSERVYCSNCVLIVATMILRMNATNVNWILAFLGG
jgi:hypothetical protein